MAEIMAKDGVILARPTGGVLATSCGSGSQHCNPCIVNEQNDAGLSVEGGCTGSVIQDAPDELFWCENWEELTWAGECCFVWANNVPIEGHPIPGTVADWVLIICYNTNVTPPRYDAAIYSGPNDPESAADPCDWMVEETPIFSGEDVDVSCGEDGKLHGTFELEGHAPYGGGSAWDAEGCTATVTLP